MGKQGELVFFQAAFQLAPVCAFCRADGHDFARNVDQLARGAAVRVRPEIPRVGAVLFARVLNGRKDVAFRERDERVALVVLEVCVEERCVLVDEVLLEHKAFMLVLRHDVLEGVDLLYKQRNLRPLVLEVHVLAHARTKLLCFAYVNDLARRIFPEINARFGRHVCKLLFDFFECCHGGSIPDASYDTPGSVETRCRIALNPKRQPPPAFPCAQSGRRPSTSPLMHNPRPKT